MRNHGYFLFWLKPRFSVFADAYPLVSATTLAFTTRLVWDIILHKPKYATQMEGTSHYVELNSPTPRHKMLSLIISVI